MTTREFNERLQRRARKAGLRLGTTVAGQLEEYFRLLDRWNEKINLTALPIHDTTDVAMDRLLIEPLVAARQLPSPTCRVMDIGSGGGSPAIPMKVFVPTLTMRLVESKVRKSAFLREVIRTLRLTDIDVETARYEELLTRPELVEAFDVVTVRAVRAETRVLMALQAFLRPDGLLFLFRGPTGPGAPSTLTPPLVWQSTHPLVDSFHSRLVIIRKLNFGFVG